MVFELLDLVGYFVFVILYNFQIGDMLRKLWFRSQKGFVKMGVDF